MNLSVKAEGNPLSPPVSKYSLMGCFGQAQTAVKYRTWQNGWPCGVVMTWTSPAGVMWSRSVPCGDAGADELTLPCSAINGLNKLEVHGCTGCFWGAEVSVQVGPSAGGGGASGGWELWLLVGAAGALAFAGVVLALEKI
jgi:hypothetical protein